MTYSVWNHARKRYDYYEAPGLAPHLPVPGHLQGGLSGSDVGLAPEAAAWPLPVGARHIGSGVEPRGMLASDESSASGGFVKAGLLAGAAFLVWRWSRGR